MRERVISEIQRLAAENGGKPPGRQAFEQATGIRYAQWYGSLWARWGDAVAEAGFTPNAVQTKFDRDAMLQYVAEAYRHLGRVATDGELRLYGRGILSAPAHSTISTHFRGKAELIEAVRSWTAARPDFADVLAMLPASPPQPAQRPPPAGRRDGSVYLIRSGDYFKIGRSDELERRVKEIRIALPDAATLEHVIATDDPPGIEAYWHRCFADRRANGEWFKLTPADVAAFRRRKFQ